MSLETIVSVCSLSFTEWLTGHVLEDDVKLTNTHTHSVKSISHRGQTDFPAFPSAPPHVRSHFINSLSSYYSLPPLVPSFRSLLLLSLTSILPRHPLPCLLRTRADIFSSSGMFWCITAFYCAPRNYTKIINQILPIAYLNSHINFVFTLIALWAHFCFWSFADVFHLVMWVSTTSVS